MIRILITSMGGSGSNSLWDGLKRSSLGEQLYCVGTHADKNELACSTADVNYLVPWVKDEKNYIDRHLKIEKDEKIDLIIPDSDKEVIAFAKHRDKFKSAFLIPNAAVIQSVQDKYSLFKMLKAHNIPMAETYAIDQLDSIESHIVNLPDQGKFWLRVRTGAGSMAATWVKTAEQARAWIRLWQELQGLKVSDFVISEFLPGKDYAAQTIWKDGRLLNAKICERLTYFYGEMRISGMASTPGIAKTVDNRAALETCIKAVQAASAEYHSVPNGIYEFDMKENADGVACLTEINIGRFPMINAIFNRTGRTNAAEIYLQAALGLDLDIPEDPYDIEPNILMIRGLDKEVTFCHADQVNEMKVGEPITRAFEDSRNSRVTIEQ